MFSELEESNKSLEDPRQLRKVLNEKGYLYFRGVIDKGEVLKTRLDIMDILRSYKLIDGRADSLPIWTGRNHPNDDERLEMHTKIHALRTFQTLRNNEEVMKIMKRLFGEPTYCWFNADVRTHIPKDAPPTPIHQDYYYLRGSKFAIAWIPLMDVDESVGGVAVAPGSNRTFRVDDYAVSETPFGGIPLTYLPEEKVQGGFARTDYRHGDVLIFDCKTAHRSLSNRSDRIRLSVDYRYQPRSSKKPWYVYRTSSWLERWNLRAADAFRELGASQTEIQRVYWPMFWKGGEPSVARIKKELKNSTSMSMT